jgi:septal ring factor EnvC (AmiA/AmiB activator)
MTPLWLVMVAIAQALAWMSEPPKSLAAAATREAIRRQVVGPSVGFYNNDTLASDRENVAEPAAPVQSVTPALTGAVERRDESWWRERVEEVRKHITTDGERISALELEIPRLDEQAISRDDPAQQATLRREANDARSELETLRTRAASRRRELSALLEEARRQDVPPGWLR